MKADAGRAYDLRMSTLRSLQDSLGQVGRSGLRASMGWSVSWWHVVKVGALILVLALSPSTYDRPGRAALARHVYLGTMAILPWFALLSALVSVVLIRIVIVTAVSYGLSQYALEMMVRVLVLELIPLAAALFVALRVTVPSGAELLRLQARGAFEAMQRVGVDPLRHELLPRVLAGSFAVLMLATVSCLIAFVLAYLAVHGFTLGAFAGFTRALGHIFNPAVSMIFGLKTLFFSLAVALIPVAALLRGERTNPELEGLVRLFAAILLIEVLSLVSNYY
jgi:phospholipid/cholesterol/gamma-HCH transport system permease protein